MARGLRGFGVDDARRWWCEDVAEGESECEDEDGDIDECEGEGDSSDCLSD